MELEKKHLTPMGLKGTLNSLVEFNFKQDVKELTFLHALSKK
jgi:hypothetical protein